MDTPISEALEAVIDESISSDWDDDFSAAETESDTAEVESNSDVVDQPETDDADNASEAEELSPVDELEQMQQKSDTETSRKITLKHLDETKDVDLNSETDISELTALAQKGMDYDRIRTERDALKSQSAEVNAHENFLKELAESSGLSVNDLIINTRARLLMSENNDKMGYPPITLEQATNRVKAQMKASAQQSNTGNSTEVKPSLDNAEGQNNIPDAKTARNENFARFVKAYPDVNAKDIPAEIWAEFGDGTKADLTTIYSRYENKQLKSQLAEMKRQAEEIQNQKPRSTGSRKSNGTPDFSEADLFAGW